MTTMRRCRACAGGVALPTSDRCGSCIQALFWPGQRCAACGAPVVLGRAVLCLAHELQAEAEEKKKALLGVDEL
jgi:hypothetical protein